ncbi:MAG TPA: SLC13 family permease [Candidatus Hypogeohydataceae bacterium YC38]
MEKYLCLGIFLACYAGFVFFPVRRSWCACAGALLLVLLGVMYPGQAFWSINWNVMGVFTGAMIIAELLIFSRLPSVLAEHIVNRTKRASWAMLSLCGLTSFLSIFLENVATVLIVAPIALRITERLKIKPQMLLIALAVCSNLQGTGTLIGDSPSMILAGYAKMSFDDFFFYGGRPGIFFAVQAGALASLGVLYFFFRRVVRPREPVKVERVRSWVPAGLLGGLVFSLALASFWRTDFPYKNGSICMTFGLAGLLLYKFKWKGGARDFIKGLDWDTGLFLMGVFVLVGGLSITGWIDVITSLVEKASGENLLRAYITIIGLSVIFSAFMDNIPYVMIMLPVVDRVAWDIHGPPALLIFGLLLGACLGGNISPFGASANMVAVGMLRSRGIVVSVWEFAKMGLPFTMAAVTAGCLFLWLVWVGPRLSYSPGKVEKMTVEELRPLTDYTKEEEKLGHIMDSMKETLRGLIEELEDLIEREDEDTERAGEKTKD